MAGETRNPLPPNGKTGGEQGIVGVNHIRVIQSGPALDASTPSVNPGLTTLRQESSCAR